MNGGAVAWDATQTWSRPASKQASKQIGTYVELFPVTLFLLLYTVVVVAEASLPVTTHPSRESLAEPDSERSEWAHYCAVCHHTTHYLPTPLLGFWTTGCVAMAWLLTGWWLAECGSCARGIDHLACVKISDAMHSMLLLLLLRGLHYVSFGSAFFLRLRKTRATVVEDCMFAIGQKTIYVHSIFLLK